MNFGSLPYKNIAWYRRYYRLIAAAALITIAVITGSLAVGDSVRTTLVNRVDERLGDTETIVFSRQSFMSDELMRTPLFADGCRGILLVNGFIPQGGKMLPVVVWGVDDRDIPPGKARVNETLLKEMGADAPTDIVLRLPSTGLVPSGSLFVTENYTTSLRLAYDGTLSSADGGNISLKNEQVLPSNIFVNRQELAEALEVAGKINLILTAKPVTEADLAAQWTYTASGLSVDRREGFTEITSDRVFLPQEVTDYVGAHNTGANRLFSYLANAITWGDQSVPYSFVTALDTYKGERLRANEAILSDYTARRLKAQTGDSITLTYYTSQDLKTLATCSLRLTVKKVVPLAELQADPTLSADFPGLSDVERCTDWDSDLPIDMDLITDEDERYWDAYRSTPKAILPYEAVAHDWGNAYGNATAVRVADEHPRLEGLHADMFGIQLIYPREAGVYAARNGVDFSSLFLALGFFIIVAAILLMLVPLSEMLYVRRHEIRLLKEIGYPDKRIRHLLWREAAPVVLVASVAGVVAGLLYTSLVIWLLGNVWKGATQTDGFAVYPNFLTLGIGLIVGIGLSLWLLRRAICRSLKEREAGSRAKRRSVGSRRTLAILAVIVSLAIIGINLLFLQSVVLFVSAGVLLIGTAALWGDYLLCSRGTVTNDGFRTDKLVWNTLYANRKQAVLSFFALAMGVFIVFSVGLNRQGFADSSQIRTGTGGYALWVETTVPVYHNLMTKEGRAKLSLSELPADAAILQCLRYGADDASCLNLNKVSRPTVLGVDMEALQQSDFRIEQSLREASDTVYPAFVDETVLTWGLMMKVGDTLRYEGDKGRPVGLRLVGTLANSIFQGNVLIDRRLFREIWPETAGSEVFLVKVKEAETEAAKELFAQALHEYGVSVQTTNDRLKQFNTVTDTYLTIFLTLGGLGLLLGIMSFVIVVRKNLAMRRREIELYSRLGYTNGRIAHILYRENILVPLYAIATGVVGSLVGVSVSFMNTSIWVWLTALLFTLFFVMCVLVFVRKSVEAEVNRNA